MLQNAIINVLSLLLTFFIMYKWGEILVCKIEAKFFELKDKWGDLK